MCIFEYYNYCNLGLLITQFQLKMDLGPFGNELVIYTPRYQLEILSIWLKILRKVVTISGTRYWRYSVRILGLYVSKFEKIILNNSDSFALNLTYEDRPNEASWM